MAVNSILEKYGLDKESIEQIPMNCISVERSKIDIKHGSHLPSYRASKICEEMWEEFKEAPSSYVVRLEQDPKGGLKPLLSVFESAPPHVKKSFLDNAMKEEYKNRVKKENAPLKKEPRATLAVLGSRG